MESLQSLTQKIGRASYRCRDCDAAAAAVVVDKVIVEVINSTSMAPCVRARNSVAVNSPDKSIVVVHMDGLDGIDGINVRG